jgi:hypothetical protein
MESISDFVVGQPPVVTRAVMAGPLFNPAIIIGLHEAEKENK